MVPHPGQAPRPPARRGGLPLRRCADLHVAPTAQRFPAPPAAFSAIGGPGGAARHPRVIYAMREENGNWSAPYPIHRDKWLIAGCPVNGPAIDRWGKQLAVVWFSAPKGKSRLQVSFSGDNGKTFGRAIRVNEGIPVGRVDVEWLDAKIAVITWMEQRGDQAVIRMRKITIGGKSFPAMDLLSSSAARTSGFPILEKGSEGLLLSTTSVDPNSRTRVKTYRIKL